MKHRGFTIVELLIVIVVIALLTGISITSYITYQDRATTGLAKSLATDLRGASERYFGKNNEYPLAGTVIAGTPSNTALTPAQYQTASQVLDIPITTLSSQKITLQTCSNGCTTVTNKTKVYYITKDTPPVATAESYVLSGCTYTFPATEIGSASYLVIYWDNGSGIWIVTRSNNGGVTTSDTALCPFKAS